MWFTRSINTERVRPLNEIPEFFYLENLEQLRALADELRQRLLHALSARPMTVAQVSSELGVPAAAVHHHIRELERVGLVMRVERHDEGSVLDEHFSAVARNVTVAPHLFQQFSPDENVRAVSDVLRDVSRSFMRAFVSGEMSEADTSRQVALTRSHLWLTDDELPLFLESVERVFAPYTHPRGTDGERERTVAHILYDTQAAIEPYIASGIAEDQDMTMPTRRRYRAAGIISWSHVELQRARERGEVLDITTIGFQRFLKDVTPDDVDGTVVRFRHWGILTASPDVRAALRRKLRP